MMNAIQHDTDTDGQAWTRCLTGSDATSTLVCRVVEYLSSKLFE